jgi:UDP-N-acetylmuramoyl-tripeptide--D-alanyl-D-alanine ligase
MIWALIIACTAASVPAGLRWLRVAQREHYLPTVSRFAWRWWTVTPVNLALLGVCLAGALGTMWAVWPGFAVALAQIGPVGLTVRGSSSPLAWTPRLRRLALVTGLMVAALLIVGAMADEPLIVVVAVLLLPTIVDLSLLMLAPVENALGSKWVDRAIRKLAVVAPEVVAVTGSYGKTTTKGYIAHLLSGWRRVVATPASFNNRMGLARAINENLTPGTEIFVAEMGTYGLGEIAEMCRWVRPKVGAIVSVGPVHLERFKTEERVVEAKSEILDSAEIGVICVDHPLLARLAAERSRSMSIVEVSTGDTGVVRIVDGKVIIDEVEIAEAPEGVFASNLAAAIGVCMALGMETAEIAPRLADLPVPEHRQTMTVSGSGFTIVDDTFNSNPAGARRALHLLATRGGSRAVITPGMVELGPRQETENENFAAEAAALADHLVIVGRTNRAALLRGAGKGRASVTVVDSREEAVAWARAHLGPGDTVLYENDLPDHYP